MSPTGILVAAPVPLPLGARYVPLSGSVSRAVIAMPSCGTSCVRLTLPNSSVFSHRDAHVLGLAGTRRQRQSPSPEYTLSPSAESIASKLGPVPSAGGPPERRHGSSSHPQQSSSPDVCTIRNRLASAPDKDQLTSSFMSSGSSPIEHGETRCDGVGCVGAMPSRFSCDLLRRTLPRTHHRIC